MVSNTKPGERQAVPAEHDGSGLELESVTAGYGQATVLRDVSLRARRGEIVALLGPNGAGKTTLLRVASGLIRATSGRVLLGGNDVTSEAPYKRTRRGLCLIPEGRGIFRSLSVGENLRMQLPAADDRKVGALDDVLAVFPMLRDRRREVAGRLSGGQQQILALARAYVSHPEVILLDEVSMGLAPMVVDEIFQALSNLAQTGVGMVVVEQYVSRAMSMADSVILLNKGQVTYVGPPSGLDDEAMLRGYLGANAQ